MTPDVTPAAELVEVVDPTGEVVGVVTRAEMRARKLRHRSAYVAVTTAAGALVVHRRSDAKDVWPGRWDLAFGGVAGVGEPWREAARRELAEEAGVDVPAAELVDLGGGAYDDGDVSVLARVFVVRHDGPFRCRDGEVVAVDTVPLADLPSWLVDRPVCPDTVALAVPRLR